VRAAAFMRLQWQAARPDLIRETGYEQRLHYVVVSRFEKTDGTSYAMYSARNRSRFYRKYWNIHEDTEAHAEDHAKDEHSNGEIQDPMSEMEDEEEDDYYSEPDMYEDDDDVYVDERPQDGVSCTYTRLKDTYTEGSLEAFVEESVRARIQTLPSIETISIGDHDIDTYMRAIDVDCLPLPDHFLYYEDAPKLTASQWLLQPGILYDPRLVPKSPISGLFWRDWPTDMSIPPPSVELRNAADNTSPRKRADPPLFRFRCKPEFRDAYFPLFLSFTQSQRVNTKKNT
jgi:hypothetical protein